MSEENSLFPDLEPTETEKNACAQNDCTQKSSKKSKSGATQVNNNTNRLTLTSELGTTRTQVKVYNDYFSYEAPEDNTKPTVDDVRKWLVGQGFSEFTEARAQFVWIEPSGEGEEKYLYAGVKFEKMG